jgi:hypothetical protein
VDLSSGGGPGIEERFLEGGIGFRDGHQAGELMPAHTIDIDSQGNIYVGESVDGRRVQKFRMVDSDTFGRLKPATSGAVSDTGADAQGGTRR